jgi:hypothetical protein
VESALSGVSAVSATLLAIHGLRQVLDARQMPRRAVERAVKLRSEEHDAEASERASASLPHNIAHGSQVKSESKI